MRIRRPALLVAFVSCAAFAACSPDYNVGAMGGMGARDGGSTSSGVGADAGDASDAVDTGDASDAGNGGDGAACMAGTTEPCNDSPGDAGACQPGTRTCQADMTWGPCVGGVQVCAGSVLWAKRFGDANVQQGITVALAPPGDVVVAGLYKGNVDFGGGTPLQSPAGGTSTFVAKLKGADGSYLWANGYSSPSSSSVTVHNAVADAFGSVVVAGEFAGSVDLDADAGPLNSMAIEDAFLLKLDSTGTYVWSKQFGSAGALVESVAVAVDSAADVVVGGAFSGSVDFGSGPVASTGPLDVFVAVYDAAGSLGWSTHYGGPNGSGVLTGVAVDVAGKVLVTGNFTGTIDFHGSAPLVGVGNQDAFLLKLDPSSGSTIWSKSFGASATNLSPTGVTSDSAANVLLLGSLNGAVDFGCGPVTPSGARDSFLVEFDALGACAWARHFEAGTASATANASAVAVDGSQHVLAGGDFTGAVDVPNIAPIQSGGATDAFLAKLNSDGNGVWTYGYGDPSDQSSFCTIAGIATDASSNVLVTGSFSGSLNLGDVPPLVSMGGEDVFVAKLGP